jgi:hypothetical protein
VNDDFAIQRTVFVCVSVVASQFLVQAGEKDQFLFFINATRFSLGNLRSVAAPTELDHQQTGIGIDSEDEFAPLGSTRKTQAMPYDMTVI